MHTATGEADCKIVTNVEIDAPASVVWSTLTDFKNMSTWSSTTQNIEGDFKEGGEITVSYKFLGFAMSVQHTLCNFEQGVQWRWSDEMEHGISNDHLYRVEAIDGTHARFINNDQLSGGDSVVRCGVVRPMMASYELLNAELKQEAEKRYRDQAGIAS